MNKSGVNLSGNAHVAIVAAARLLSAFKGCNLLDPTVELVGLSMDVATASGTDNNSGSPLLKVSSMIMPYVDRENVRPVIGLRLPPPSGQQVYELRAASHAILDEYGSAITARSVQPSS
jgi:hypothetical protein